MWLRRERIRYTKETSRCRKRMVVYNGWFMHTLIDSSTDQCQNYWQMAPKYSLLLQFCTSYLVTHTPLNHTFIISLTTTMMTYNIGWRGKLSSAIVWIHREWSLWWRAAEWLHESSCVELRCGKIWMVMLRFTSWGVLANHDLKVNYTLCSCLFFTGALKVLSLWMTLQMEILVENLFPDTSFSQPNIHLVRIQLSLQSRHRERRHLWLSTVPGWGQASSHLAESLSRMCHL